ncbi:unnamed protein product, partial [Phaeothamnion confervicola]
MPGFEFRTNATRFTAPVRDVCYSPNGNMMAMAGEQPGIRVV